MPLRDHFHPPVTNINSWEALNGGWPAVIVQKMHGVLPGGYTAGPRIHHGAFAASSVPFEPDSPNVDEYEVQVFADDGEKRRLVAAIEIVSPANKDRPERRTAFISKCAGLLQSGVAVSIVDIVTTQQHNLYAELMSFVGQPDQLHNATAPFIYTASCRYIRQSSQAHVEAWRRPLTLGQPLPKIPLWLAEALVVPLDLEESYEQACRDLWIA